MQPLLVEFAAGSSGPWRVESIDAIRGDTLASASRLSVTEQPGEQNRSIWKLRGSTSNARYSTRNELDALSSRQHGLGRPEATCAALIPIRKSATWWALAQNERRAIMEERSHHIAIGMDYLPAVARRLHHSRELGEPFDFLTWFEFAPVHASAFDHMLMRLRATEEWHYVEREVDVRLTR